MQRKKLLKLSLILIMMLSLLPGMPASANTGNEGKIKILSQGTKLTEISYVVPIQDGRDTLELIDTQSAGVKALQGIVASKDIQIDKLILAVQDLNRNRLQERAEWQTQVKNISDKNYELNMDLTKEKHKRWTIGPFIGVAHTGEGVIGIGITYSIVKF